MSSTFTTRPPAKCSPCHCDESCLLDPQPKYTQRLRESGERGERGAIKGPERNVRPWFCKVVSMDEWVPIVVIIEHMRRDSEHGWNNEGEMAFAQHVFSFTKNLL